MADQTTQTTQETTEQKTDTAQIITSVINIIFTAVLPGVIKLIEELRKQDFTVDDIERLKMIVKRPEEFFTNPQEGSQGSPQGS